MAKVVMGVALIAGAVALTVVTGGGGVFVLGGAISMTAAQTASAALMLVGWFMFKPLLDLNKTGEIDFATGFAVLLTVFIMPLTYSITNGIGAGFLAYVFLKAVSGKSKDVSLAMWLASLAFLIYFADPLIRKFLQGRDGVDVVDRMRILRLIENMTIGRNAVGYLTESLHGAGSPQAQRIQIARGMKLEDKKARARALAGLGERTR